MDETCTMYMNTHEPKKKCTEKKETRNTPTDYEKCTIHKFKFCVLVHTPQRIGLFYACAQLNILTS